VPVVLVSSDYQSCSHVVSKTIARVTWVYSARSEWPLLTFTTLTVMSPVHYKYSVAIVKPVLVCYY